MLRLEMAVCMKLGIRHSEFMSWDRDDRDKALWFHIHELETCPDCGTRPDEWDPDKGGSDTAYRAELHKCWGCNERALAEKKVTEAMGAGVRPVLVADR